MGTDYLKQYVCVAKSCGVTFSHGDAGTKLRKGNSGLGWCAQHNPDNKPKEATGGSDQPVSSSS